MSNRTLAEMNLRGFPSRVVVTTPDSLMPSVSQNPEGCLVVCDQNTALIPIPGIDEYPRVVVPAGERSKQYDVLISLLDSFINHGLTRKSTVIAVGGGAITDLVAFGASIYLRGVEVVLVPTSLLAMVDAAIGGKTGIDHRGYKNMVGSFYPAKEIRICPDLLDTLSDREYRSGMAEVIKAGLLGDQNLVELLENRVEEVLRRDRTLLETVISQAVRVKTDIVQRDFTEQGERAYLNLGHTFGHALESVLGLGNWTHGEAVAWGIARAMKAGRTLGITDRHWAERVVTLLERYGYSTGPAPVEADAILRAMKSDKKRTAQGIQFVLQRGPQQNERYTLVRDQIIDILLQ